MTETLDDEETPSGEDGGAVDEYDFPVVESHDAGPLDEEGARRLLTEWATAEMTAQHKMAEIMQRRAWEPLGYDNPRDMIIHELRGKLINSRTGRPYQRAHLYRIARAAMLQHVIADELGVGPGELHISERQLRQLKSDEEDSFVEQVKEAADSLPEEVDTDRAEYVQELVDDTLDKVGPDQAAVENANASVDDTPDGTSPTGSSGGPQSSPPSDPFDEDLTNLLTDDPSTASSDTSTAPSSGADASAQASKPQTAPASGTGPSNADMKAALDGIMEFDGFRKVLASIADLGGTLPSVTQVKDKLPEFVDNCLPEELAEFREQLTQAQEELQKIPEAIEAMQDVVAVVEEREEDEL